MSLYLNGIKSQCFVTDVQKSTKYDNDCIALLNNTLETLTVPNDVEEIKLSTNIVPYTFTTVKFEEPCKMDVIYGFDNLQYLQTVELPSGITQIGKIKTIDEGYGFIYNEYSGFSSCYSLTSINIPNTVIRLEDGCFKGCSSLQSITISNSVTSMGSSCFAGDGWTDNGYELSVTFEEPCQMTYIPNSCFYGQLQLKSFTIPSSVKSLRSNCFQGTGLTSITIPNTVETMTEIEIVTNLFGDTEERESNWQFTGCENLTEVIFEEPCQIKKLPDYCFNSCKLLTEITIPSSVEEIGEECFAPHWEATEPITITINKPEGSIAGAPWGATNATIVWNG